MSEHEEYSDDDEEGSPHAQQQQDSAMFIPRQMMAGSFKKGQLKAEKPNPGGSNKTDIYHYSKMKRQSVKVILN